MSPVNIFAICAFLYPSISTASSTCYNGKCPVDEQTSLMQIKQSVKAGSNSSEKKIVLLVIDMQNDYRGEPYIKKTFDSINEWQKKADLTIWTQDWLEEWQGFAVKNTKGSEIMEEIAPAKVDGTHWLYTKNTDDAFSIMDAAPEDYDVKGLKFTTETAFDKKRKFSIEPEKEGITKPTPLAARLAEAGYLPSNTQIVCVGTQQTRCVFKSALHAKRFGYDTTVPLESSAGGQSFFNEKWRPTKCPDGIKDCDMSAMFAVPEPTCKPAKGEDKCTEAELHLWMKDLYDGYHGGPLLKDVPQYFETAGINVVQ